MANNIDRNGIEWVRVKDARLDARNFSLPKHVADADKDRYTVVRDDALDDNGMPLPPKYVTVDQPAAPTEAPTNTKPATK